MPVALAHPASAADVHDLDREVDILAVRLLDRADDVEVAGGLDVGRDADIAEDAGVLQRTFQHHCEPVRLGSAQLGPDPLPGVVVGIFGESGFEHRDDDVEPHALVGVECRSGGRAASGSDRRTPRRGGASRQHRKRDHHGNDGATRLSSHRHVLRHRSGVAGEAGPCTCGTRSTARLESPGPALPSPPGGSVLRARCRCPVRDVGRHHARPPSGAGCPVPFPDGPRAARLIGRIRVLGRIRALNPFGRDGFHGGAGGRSGEFRGPGAASCVRRAGLVRGAVTDAGRVAGGASGVVVVRNGRGRVLAVVESRQRFVQGLIQASDPLRSRERLAFDVDVDGAGEAITGGGAAGAGCGDRNDQSRHRRSHGPALPVPDVTDGTRASGAT